MTAILDFFKPPAHPFEQPEGPHTDAVIKAANIIKEASDTESSGFGFAEIMEGFVHISDNLDGDELVDFEIATKTARGLCQAARFFLSVKSWNTATSEYNAVNI
jgi:hypothetical protein